MTTNSPITDFLNEPKRIRWVVLSHDKKYVLADPTTKLPYCTDSLDMAKIIARDVTIDFGTPASPCELHQALTLVAKYRYGLDVKSSNNPDELAANVLKAILTETNPPRAN